MKIAFLAPEFYNAWGGVGIYSMSLIKELSKDKDIELHVITPDIDDKKRKDAITKEFKGVTFHTVSVARDTFLYNFKFQIGLIKKLPQLQKEHGFDLLHSANIVHMPDIFCKLQRETIPTVVTCHTTIHGQVAGFLQSNKNPFKMAESERSSIALYPAISLLEKLYMARTGHFITVSKKFKHILEEDYHLKDVEVIYNCIDISNYDFRRISLADCRNKFPVLKGINRPTILFAGRLITQKGIDLLIEALSMMRDLGTDFHAIFAGKGDTERLNQLIREHNLEGSVTFTGYIENKDLCYLYRFADVFCLPSYYENFPIGLLEAMSMQCCPVATDVGAVDEIIDDGKDGYIIKPGDRESLAMKLTVLLSNNKLRNKMAKVGMAKIRKRHSSSIMASQHKELYKRMLK